MAHEIAGSTGIQGKQIPGDKVSELRIDKWTGMSTLDLLGHKVLGYYQWSLRSNCFLQLHRKRTLLPAPAA
jgi:hypothetical protein